MFSHLLAGELVFLVLAYIFGIDITAKLLFLGAFCGFLPDILSHVHRRKIVKNNKWFHKHRDNFSHSIFLPILVFLFLFFWIDIRIALMIALAIASHSFFDLWGIGWGVKLFMPFSTTIYKLFYGQKFLYIFKTEREREKEVKKHGEDDWFKVAYFFSRPSRMLKWWGVFEWTSLALAIALPILYYFF